MNWEYVIPNVEVGDRPRATELPMNNEAFAGFYERSARPLWAYLARVSSDPALADDLMQESYVRFLCASRADDGEVASRRYLFRIATNLLRDHWRRPASASIEDLPEELFATSDRSDHIAQIRAVIAGLQPFQPEPFHLGREAHRQHVLLIPGVQGLNTLEKIGAHREFQPDMKMFIA